MSPFSLASQVMIPIPQYPLYTATLALLNGQAVEYYLNEANDWGLDASVPRRIHPCDPGGTLPTIG
jgi:aspartate/methionine/tyrosine aminotransferase